MVFFKQTIQFLQQIDVKNVHPVYRAGVPTHDLWNMSLRPKPLDQGSLPRSWLILFTCCWYISKVKDAWFEDGWGRLRLILPTYLTASSFLPGSYESAKACAVVIDNNNSDEANNEDGSARSNPIPASEEVAKEYSVASSSSSPTVLGN